MRTFKRILFFYLINIVTWFCTHLIFGGSFIPLLKNPATWIFPLVPVLIAQFIAFLIHQGGKENQRPYINTITYLVCTVILNGFIFNELYSNWKWERDNGNIESNRMFFDMRNDVPDQGRTKIAFDTLMQKFKTANDIELVSSSAGPRNTFLNDQHLPDTLFEVKFRYNKKGMQYKAALLVYQLQAQLLYYDQPLNRKDNIEIDFQKRKDRYEVNGIMKQLPDSIRGEVEEAFKKF